MALDEIDGGLNFIIGIFIYLDVDGCDYSWPITLFDGFVAIIFGNGHRNVSSCFYVSWAWSLGRTGVKVPLITYLLVGRAYSSGSDS